MAAKIKQHLCEYNGHTFNSINSLELAKSFNGKTNKLNCHELVGNWVTLVTAGSTAFETTGSAPFETTGCAAFVTFHISIHSLVA